MSFGTRARIRLGAIQHNLSVIKAAAPGAKVMAVVKANAYGHGLTEVARSLAGVDSLAVARLAEAQMLRNAGIDASITLLGGVLSSDDLSTANELDVSVGFHHEQQIDFAEKAGHRLSSAWLKVDTGMGRLGFRPVDVPDAIDRLGRHVDHLGILSHFSSADDLQNSTTADQLSAFLELIGQFEGPISIANSAALLGWRDALEVLNDYRKQGRLWIRPGLSLYGISPFPGKTGSDLGLAPAMQLEATLLSVKRLNAGDRVGYGGTWQATKETMLGVISGGYGDGYSRFIPSGTPVLVNGRRVPVAGRISMDLTAVDLGSGAQDEIGDRVVFWGDGLPVEEIAECASTIPYQLLCGVTHRESPIYID